MVRTLEAAAEWVDEVGLALLFPKADVVLPSLWEQVNGSPERNWAVRDADGTFMHWSEELAFLWSAKDDLPADGLVCVGKHVVLPSGCPETMTWLNHRGYQTHAVPLDEFMKSGGSAKCLTLALD